ncbi:hypothetical protein FA15DRAFT_653223 [Coprinopsis marcescibilis]|uniref:Uncharacterized protein n=1 Tax=Coprinopsis marcescibilis TaxID=230819 RepID=A0A5C3LHA7_COPMA|nr:hypothetical protein FA15DRAFT_653223 [Coprinopsis marcescibilis]
MSSSTSLSSVTCEFDEQSEPLCLAHQCIQELELEVQKLTLQAASLDLELATQTCKQRSRKAISGAQAMFSTSQQVISPHSGISPTSEAVALVNMIDMLTRKGSYIYLYLFSPYLLTDGIFGHPKPLFLFNSKERFANGVLLAQRQAADLYAAIPETDHHYVSSSHKLYANKSKHRDLPTSTILVQGASHHPTRPYDQASKAGCPLPLRRGIPAG